MTTKEATKALGAAKRQYARLTLKVTAAYNAAEKAGHAVQAASDALTAAIKAETEAVLIGDGA